MVALFVIDYYESETPMKLLGSALKPNASYAVNRENNLPHFSNESHDYFISNCLCVIRLQ